MARPGERVRRSRAGVLATGVLAVLVLLAGGVALIQLLGSGPRSGDVEHDDRRAPQEQLYADLEVPHPPAVPSSTASPADESE